MKTFLVPVDFSAVSEVIIDAAATFARAFGGKVFLVHAVQPPIVTSEYALPITALEEALAAAEKAATQKLADYTTAFKKAGLDCTSLVRQGPPVHVITEEAARLKADFIVMGSHGHGKFYDLFVGSTASGVLKRAKCGVIILPPVDKTG